MVGGEMMLAAEVRMGTAKMMRCINKNCIICQTRAEFPEGTAVCPLCGEPLEGAAVGEPTEGMDLKEREDAHWLEKIANDDAYWISDADQAYPSVVAYEYRKLREYCRAGNAYAALLSLKDNFEALLKLEVLLTYAWAAQNKDKDFEKSTISLLTTPNLTMGAWVELSLKMEKACGADIPEGIPLKQLRKTYDRNGIVNWRNDRIGHGAMGLEESEDFREEIKNRIIILRDVYASIDEQLRQQELYLKAYEGEALRDGKAVVGGEILLTGADKARGLANGGKIWFRTADGEIDFCADPFIILRKDINNGYGIYFFDNQRTKEMSKFLAYVQGKYVCEGTDYFCRLRRELDTGDVSLGEAADSKLLTEEEERLLDSLQMSHTYVRPEHIKKWLGECLKNNDKGVFLLQMERGTGKSTFTEKLNCLYKNPEKIADDLDVRTYHLSRTQSAGAEDFRSTIEWQWGNQYEGRNWAKAPTMESFMNDGMEPAAALCAFLNKVKEYTVRNRGKKRLLMVLDGLDEIKDDKLWSYIPSSEELEEGIYFLLTSRNPETEDLPENTRRHLEELVVTDKYCVERKSQNNIDFLNKYINNAGLKSINKEQKELLMERSEYRVLLLGILCRLVNHGLNIQDLPDTSEVVAEYLKTLEEGYGEGEAMRLKEMLVALCTLGMYEPLTMQTLGTIFSEGGITLRLIGIIRDLSPLLRTERGKFGNAYTLANEDLAKELLEQIGENTVQGTVRSVVQLSMSLLRDRLQDPGPIDFSEAMHMMRDTRDYDDGYRLEGDILKQEPGIDAVMAHVTDLAKNYLPEGVKAMGEKAGFILNAWCKSQWAKPYWDARRLPNYYRQSNLYWQVLAEAERERQKEEHTNAITYDFEGPILQALRAEEQLGVILALMGEDTQAIPILEDAYRKGKKEDFLGESSRWTLLTQFYLATALGRLGRTEEAIKILEDACENAKGVFDIESVLQIQLAEMLGKLGYLDEADDKLNEVVERGSHREINLATSAMARMYAENGEDITQQAVLDFEKMYQEQKDEWGEDDPITQDMLDTLCLLYYKTENYEKALDKAIKRYEYVKAWVGEEHPKIWRLAQIRALIIGRLGNRDDRDEMLRIQEDLIEKNEQKYGNNHPQTLLFRHNYAVLLGESGRNEEALQILRDVYNREKALLGEKHIYTRDTKRELAGVLEILGEYEEAARYRQELANVWAEAWSPE